MEIAALNSTLCYENLPELPPRFLHPRTVHQGWDFASNIKISVFCSYKKTLLPKHTEAFEREIQPHEMLKYLCESVVVL